MKVYYHTRHWGLFGNLGSLTFEKAQVPGWRNRPAHLFEESFLISIDDPYSSIQVSAMPNNSINQLKRAVQLAEQIDRLEAELNQILANAGGKASSTPSAAPKAAASTTAAPKAGKKGGMSAAGRARIAAAQKARWAKIKAAKSPAAPAPAASARTAPAGKRKPRRGISAEARARMVAGAKARWAQIKAGKAPAPKRKTSRK